MDNTKIIENTAINKLENVLLSTRVIEPSINKGDTYPSWDGELLLYNDQNFAKSNLYGRIPVQIKGRYTNDGFPSYLSYPYEVADLRNYYTDGGVFYFVVYYDENDDFIIYYDMLLPFDIEQMLAGKNEQKTINQYLYKINKDDNIVAFLKSFINNKKKQISGKDITNIKHDTLEGIRPENVQRINTLDDGYDLNYPTYIYGQLKGVPFEIPVEKVFLKWKAYGKKDVKVSLDGEIFNMPLEVKKYATNIIFKIGKSFILDVEAQRMETHFAGNLSEMVRDLKFAIKLEEAKELKIEDSKVFKVDSLQDKIKIVAVYKNNLAYLQKVQKTLLYFDVTEELKWDNVTDEDIKNINILIDAIERQEYRISPMHKMEPLYVLKISNLLIAVGLTECNDGRFKVCKIFQDSIFGLPIEMIGNLDGKKYQCSIFSIILKTKDFIELSNLNYNAILESVTSIQWTITYGEQLAIMGNQILNAFDICKKPALLEFSLGIWSWMFSSSKDSIYRINCLQTVYRQRSLSNDENIELMKIKQEQICDTLTVLSVNILLGNDTEAKIIYGCLTHEELDKFKTLPISNIYGENSIQ